MTCTRIEKPKFDLEMASVMTRRPVSLLRLSLPSLSSLLMTLRPASTFTLRFDTVVSSFALRCAVYSTSRSYFRDSLLYFLFSCRLYFSFTFFSLFSSFSIAVCFNLVFFSFPFSSSFDSRFYICSLSQSFPVIASCTIMYHQRINGLRNQLRFISPGDISLLISLPTVKPLPTT